MAAQAHEGEQPTNTAELSDNQQQTHEKLLTSYLGLTFAVYLGLTRSSSLSSLQSRNRDLCLKLIEAEEQLRQLRSRRKEDSKANARVVEIFASQRHAWRREEERLLRGIDAAAEEIARLRERAGELESSDAELRREVEELRREVGEREEMLNFVTRQPEFEEGGRWCSEAAVEADVQYESLESLCHLKHFASRRESPWKLEGEASGVSSKLKLLEQELLNLERIGKSDLSKVPSKMRKQTRRYQTLAGKIDNLCRRMQASDPTLSSELRAQRQTEFLIEALRLQQRASETGQKLMALQTETGKGYFGDDMESQAKLTTRRCLDSIKNNFKEIQRNLEIWLARIVGDVEGILARDGASRVKEYYVSRSGTNPFKW
ncbi:uncharacterized protein LOC131306650 isoform X3 [Rhododendron vialii]|uniref:uncharacterized protein LOC131306650 isoform X3 n=1 Tax=Rhododendron vialii TaxID=182163 RepID=UPI00265F7393|nr:uncharacterized protein LOC131306650 isoform X3 [Rhododendron vialii]